MKELKDIIVFRCEHCNKISLNKGAMAMHEKHCTKNPDIRPMCDDCFGLNYPNEKQHFKIAYEYSKYECDLHVRECRYYGKMFAKLRGELADVVACEGWMRMPCASQGCIHYLSADDMDKIRDWARKNNGLAGISPQIFSKYDVPATPELAYRYFTAIGDTENANRFGPPKDNDDWSDISESKTLMNPKPSGLPIHDIVN